MKYNGQAKEVAGMKCEDVKKILPEYLKENPENNISEKVGGHIETCPHCRKEVAQMKESWEILNQWQEIEPAEGFARRTMARILEEEERRKQPSLSWIMEYLTTAFSFRVPAWGVMALVILALFAGRLIQPRQAEKQVVYVESPVKIAQLVQVQPSPAFTTDMADIPSAGSLITESRQTEQNPEELLSTPDIIEYRAFINRIDPLEVLGENRS